MKISYIITPFKSSEYLVRCVNSILRQTGENNEIIIAENAAELTDEVDNYIFSVCGAKRISDKPISDFEKISEAVKAAKDGSLIKLIDVDTVAVPIASAEAAECEADIVFAAVAIKHNEDYDIERPDVRFSLQNAFIKKETLAAMPQEAFDDPFLFELWMDKNISSGVEYGCTDDICFYIQKENDERAAGTAQKYIEYSAELTAVFESSLKSDRKAGLQLFDKYISKLYKFMCSEQYDYTVKESIFNIIKDAARLIGDNEFAQRLFLLYFGASAEAIADMDIQAYLFFSQRVLTLSDKAIVTAQLEQIVENSTASLRKSLSVIDDIKSKQDEEAKRTKSMSEEVNKLKNDIAALTKNMHFVFNSASVVGETEAYTEPLQQIPAMFAQGKLGLKVIMKSFKAWLKYKFSRKKK